MRLSFEHDEVDGLTGAVTHHEVEEQPLVSSDHIVPPSSRNAPCPCGSGLKYKQCHGRL
ncbi:uncharacterized protein YecA (UPF0149 family) [Acinetobacter baylyi]|uniref:Uncharacterized protein YecA (UPF0149 family) n=2 Tax=Acinetobacter baylyi TaxID=202950 RepID=A0ABU0UZ41_ACIBI|nr:uncharacterized protein YecA (UPF0149 family) [Acinetobacter baylyi]